MRNGKMVVDSKLSDLQSDQHLLISVDNQDAATYLNAIDGVLGVKNCETSDGLHNFILDSSLEIAPNIASAVHDAGDKLYALQPEKRTLETLFAEVNMVSEQEKEVAHA